MQLLEQFFLSFGLLSLVALFGGFLATRWRQPTVVGLILAGMIMGPHGLGLVSDTQLIDMLAEFGAAMLLFSIGVEFSISKILGSGARSLILASVIMLGLFTVGYELGVVLNLDYIQTLALAACLTFSSTAIFVRLLQQYNLLEQPQVPLLISVLVIEDLVAVAAMAFFTAMGSETAQSGSTPVVDILLALVFAMAIMGTVYFGIRAVFKRAGRFTEGLRTRDNLVLLALGMCVLLAFLASFVGLSPAIGAFMAGSILAGTPMRDEIERVISPFSLAFSSFFFVSIGLLVNPAAAIAYWPVILMCSVCFVLAAFFVVGLALFFSGYHIEQAVVSSLAMGCLGEFSLFLAQESAPLLGTLDLVTIMSTSVVLTTLVSSFLLSRHLQIAAAVRKHFAGSRAWMTQTREYFSSVLAEFENQGVFLTRARAVFCAMRRHLTLFALVGLAILISRRLLATSVVVFLGYPIHLPTVSLLISFALLAPALLDIFDELRLLMDALTAVFVKNQPGDSRSGRRMARDFMLLIAFLGITAVQAILIDVFNLPDFMHLIVFVPIMVMILVVWDMISLMHQAIAARKDPLLKRL